MPNTRDLPCKLTDGELLQRGNELARTQKAIALVDNERKEASASYRQRLMELEAKSLKLTIALDTGMEDRPIRVREEPDYGRGKMVLIREDTGQTVETRPLEPEERQTTIDDKLGSDTTAKRGRKLKVATAAGELPRQRKRRSPKNGATTEDAF